MSPPPVRHSRAHAVVPSARTQSSPSPSCTARYPNGSRANGNRFAFLTLEGFHETASALLRCSDTASRADRLPAQYVAGGREGEREAGGGEHLERDQASRIESRRGTRRRLADDQD